MSFLSAIKSASPTLPARFADLKRTIVPVEAEARLTESWNELLSELAKFAKDVEERGSDIIPVVDYKDLATLTPELKERIKKCGTVIVRNLVKSEVCLEWKDSLTEYVKNTDVQGFPEENKQFFHLYWSAAQVQARADPNILDATVFLNSLWHTSGGDVTLPSLGVDPKQPLSYADRFRLRQPGQPKWDAHPPHVDGGAIERWEDTHYRAFYKQILEGNWRQHDPYVLDDKIKSKSNLYRSTSSTIFRTFQGWLALSETGPRQGTLQVFPNLLLSSAYIMLRPFFQPVETPVSDDPLAPENWKFDVSWPDFPGIFPYQNYYSGPKLRDHSHPHMKLATSMVSIPKVNPGDMVFWHCDVVHAVEEEHIGSGDSSVIYIPATPSTDENRKYIREQRETFERGEAPPDFATTQITPERDYKGKGKTEDLKEVGRRPMGFDT